MAPMKWRAGMPLWLANGSGLNKGVGDPFSAVEIVEVAENGHLTVRKGGHGASVAEVADAVAQSVVDPSKVDCFAANPADTTAPDHCALIHLNDPCILENSRARFKDDHIYTYVGHILIAINPFARLPIYGPKVMETYVGKELGDRKVEPHVYAVGEVAFRNMMTTKKATALVMSGESGAGKTETTKQLMNYIAWCSAQASKGSTIGQKLADAIISS